MMTSPSTHFTGNMASKMSLEEKKNKIKMESMFQYNVVYVSVQCCVCCSTTLCMLQYNVVYVSVQCCVCCSTMLCMLQYNVVYVAVQC